MFEEVRDELKEMYGLQEERFQWTDENNQLHWLTKTEIADRENG